MPSILTFAPPTIMQTPAFAHNHEMYTYLAERGLRDGDRHTQAIATATFFVLYGLKVLKRDYLPPTPARSESVTYRIFVQFVTFSTVIVVVATALWARALHAAGHTQVAVVGDIVQGWNPVKSVPVGAFGVQAELGAAIPLALIGFLEAFSMARKFALANKYEVDMNQEAAALGLANLLSCPFRYVWASVCRQRQLRSDAIRSIRLDSTHSSISLPAPTTTTAFSRPRAILGGRR